LKAIERRPDRYAFVRTVASMSLSWLQDAVVVERGHGLEVGEDVLAHRRLGLLVALIAGSLRSSKRRMSRP
jgi:hypothetical protein